jgi:hypothetical protein
MHTTRETSKTIETTIKVFGAAVALALVWLVVRAIMAFGERVSSLFNAAIQ